MGAWIEIRREQICAECPTAAPTWVCGLKRKKGISEHLVSRAERRVDRNRNVENNIN